MTDNVTGLVWQQEDDDTTRTWDTANSYCQGLTLGGETDWRLPMKKEFVSIVDYGAYNPTINSAYFPNTNSSLYWSSTTYAYDTANAWFVDFYFGSVSSNVKAKYYYVRCVRGGQ